MKLLNKSRSKFVFKSSKSYHLGLLYQGGVLIKAEYYYRHKPSQIQTLALSKKKVRYCSVDSQWLNTHDEGLGYGKD